MQREVSMRRLDTADTAVAMRPAQQPHGEVSTSIKAAPPYVRTRTPTELSA
jgi:hypothetical protein